MRLRTLYLPAFAGILLLAGCAGGGARRDGASVEPAVPVAIPRQLPAVADQRSYQAMAHEARGWQRRAAAVDGEWRDVEWLLRRAAQAAAAGDYVLAVDLAESARFQAEMGYRQMQAQPEVSNPAYLYY